MYMYKHLFWQSQLALVGSGRTGDPHWSWLPVATFTMQRFVGCLKNEFKLSKLHKSKFAYPLARSADGPKSNYARMRMNDKAHSKNVWLVSNRRLRPGNLGTKPGPVLCNKLTSSNVHQSVSANNINELVSGEVRSLSPGNGCNLLESGQCVWTVAHLRVSTCFVLSIQMYLCVAKICILKQTKPKRDSCWICIMLRKWPGSSEQEHLDPPMHLPLWYNPSP